MHLACLGAMKRLIKRLNLSKPSKKCNLSVDQKNVLMNN